MWIPDLADPGRMAALLAEHATDLGLGGVGRVHLVDARLTNPHRPGSPRCGGWALYRVCPPEPGADIEGLWYLRAFPAGTGEQAWATHRAAHPGSEARYLRELDLVAWPFPEDPSLPLLVDLIDPRTVWRHLPDGVAGSADAAGTGQVSVDVVRYQPEASAVLRVTLAGPAGRESVYAKLLAAGDVAALAATQARLWERARLGGALQVAEPLAADPAGRILWTREVPGRPLTAVLRTADRASRDRLADAVAALLADLHASGAATGPGTDLTAVAEEVDKKVAKLVAAHPPVADRLGALASGTDVLRGRAAGRQSVHGDFHVDQLRSTAAGLVLLDLDSVTTGPVELDLAELVVDLVLRRGLAGMAERFLSRVLTAYERRGDGLEPALLRALADAEFVNRCYRHLRHHAPGWQGLLEHELAGHRLVTTVLSSLDRRGGVESVEG